jgi:hypothetical protein
MISSSSSCSELSPGALGFFLGTGFPEGGAFPPPPLLRCFAGAGGGGAGGVARDAAGAVTAGGFDRLGGATFS